MGLVKRQEEICIMREAGHIVAETLALLQQKICPGVTTQMLDEVAEAWIRKRGADPSFLGYPPGSRFPFPASICASVNNVLVHGIPDTRVLQEGNVVTIDVGACYRGYHADAAYTFPVGQISEEAQALLSVAQGALHSGVSKALAGYRLGDISAAVQGYVESRGYYVAREYTGHGIGKRLHEQPQVLNYGVPGTGLLLQAGMALCIEPMVLIDSAQTRVARDHWAVISFNGKLTAHFEHTLVIMPDGEPEVLTEL